MRDESFACLLTRTQYTSNQPTDKALRSTLTKRQAELYGLVAYEGGGEGARRQAVESLQQ